MKTLKEALINKHTIKNARIEGRKEIPASRLKNMSVKDLKPGWIVFIYDKNYDKVIPRVVIPIEYCDKLLYSNPKEDFLFVRVNDNEKITYVAPRYYENTFPEHKNDKKFNILKIYENYIPDLERICKDKNTFIKWYEENIRCIQ